MNSQNSHSQNGSGGINLTSFGLHGRRTASTTAEGQRKRPRPVVSLAGIKIVAPPESRFHRPKKPRGAISQSENENKATEVKSAAKAPPPPANLASDKNVAQAPIQAEARAASGGFDSQSVPGPHWSKSPSQMEGTRPVGALASKWPAKAPPPPANLASDKNVAESPVQDTDKATSGGDFDSQSVLRPHWSKSPSQIEATRPIAASAGKWPAKAPPPPANQASVENITESPFQAEFRATSGDGLQSVLLPHWSKSPSQLETTRPVAASASKCPAKAPPPPENLDSAKKVAESPVQDTDRATSGDDFDSQSVLRPHCSKSPSQLEATRPVAAPASKRPAKAPPPPANQHAQAAKWGGEKCDVVNSPDASAFLSIDRSPPSPVMPLEEIDILNRIETSILLAEEEAVLERLDRDIRRAEKKKRRGKGRRKPNPQEPQAVPEESGRNTSPVDVGQSPPTSHKHHRVSPCSPQTSRIKKRVTFAELPPSIRQRDAPNSPTQKDAVSSPPKLIITKYNDFEKTFDSTRPLGAFFVTESKGAGEKVCMVHSTWIGGQMDPDKRIKQGTIVDAVVIGARRQRVRGHRELYRFFDESTKAKRKITLALKTPESTGKDNVATVDKSWTFDGKWDGLLKDGWAGGAAMVRRRETNASLETSEFGNFAGRAHGPEPLPRNASGILNGNGIVENKTHLDPKAIFSTPLNISIQSLEAAVRDMGCKELIQVLETGVSQDPAVIDGGLQQCYNVVKELISANERELQLHPFAERLKDRAEDLLAKKTVLNVYINSLYNMDKAFALEHWGLFALRVVAADLNLKNDKLIAGKASVFGKVRLVFGNGVCGGQVVSSIKSSAWLRPKETRLTSSPRWPLMRQGELQHQPLCEFLLFDEDTQTREMLFMNNPFIRMEKRSLQVDLFVSENGKMNNEALLCRFELPCDRVSEDSDVYDTPVSMKISSEHCNQKYLQSGELSIQISRRRMDRDYIENKKQEVVHSVSEQLDNIARFNNDQMGKIFLAPGIQGRFGKSNIHAAIHLKNLPLIEKLCGLGARFFDDGGPGTPLAVVKSRRDQIHEDFQSLEVSPDSNKTAVEATRKLLANFDKMVEFVGQMACPPPPS